MIKVMRSSIKIRHLEDCDPDLSYLGEFVSEPPNNGSAYIDRTLNTIFWQDSRGSYHKKVLDDCGYERHSLRYYVSCNHAQLGDMRNWKHCNNQTRAKVCAEFGSLRNADIAYTYQDLRRLLDYGNGWVTIGIQAELEYTVNGLIQTLHSDGLWGIESDSGSAYFDEIQAEQIKELYKTAHALGLTIVNDGEPSEPRDY